MICLLVFFRIFEFITGFFAAIVSFKMQAAVHDHTKPIEQSQIMDMLIKIIHDTYAEAPIFWEIIGLIDTLCNFNRSL